MGMPPREPPTKKIKHPAFGTQVGDSLRADGKGGTLSEHVYEMICRERLKDQESIEEYQRRFGREL
jgi:hypothetical protein